MNAGASASKNANTFCRLIVVQSASTSSTSTRCVSTVVFNEFKAALWICCGDTFATSALGEQGGNKIDADADEESYALEAVSPPWMPRSGVTAMIRLEPLAAPLGEPEGNTKSWTTFGPTRRLYH